MSDNRSSNQYTILLLIDNTATMGRNTHDSYPFISYAKSTARSIIEDRSKNFRVRLIMAFSDIYGNPKIITQNYQSYNATPIEINNLDISPCGIFDKTVQEGLIELNKLRHQTFRDLTEPFFFPKKNDNYSILIFSDGETLSRSFHQFNANNEWLFRPDESIYFCHTYQDHCDRIKNLYATFSEAYEQLDIDFIPLNSAYSSASTSLSSKVFNSPFFFHFCLNFGSVIAKAKVAASSSPWPFPYDSGTNKQGNVMPFYFCQRTDKPMSVKRLKYTKYDVIAKLDRVEYGQYFLLQCLESPPFAILSVRKEYTRLKLLPWNFQNLLQIMNPAPSRSDCDQYMSSVPPFYLEGLSAFFNENKFEYSSEQSARKQTRPALTRMREREEYFKIHVTNMDCSTGLTIIDPIKYGHGTLKTLLEEMPQVRRIFHLKKTHDPIVINLDTIDDKNFQSLEAVRVKQTPMLIFQRSVSPVSEDLIKSMLPRQIDSKESLAEAEALTESIERMTSIDDGDDQFSLLEDFLILLRDKDSNELVRKLKILQKNEEMYTFVKSFLLKSMKRFNIDNLPEPLLEILLAD